MQSRLLRRVSSFTPGRFMTSLSEGETRIQNILIAELKPTKVVVKDVSGGCGSMYNITIESPMFQGKAMVAQHKMVNAALKEEIKQMHGLTLKTSVSPP